MTHEAKMKRLEEIGAELKSLELESGELYAKGPDAVGYQTYFDELKRISKRFIALSDEATRLYRGEQEDEAGASPDGSGQSQSFGRREGRDEPEPVSDAPGDGQTSAATWEELTAPNNAVALAMLSDKQLVDFGLWCTSKVMDIFDGGNRQQFFASRRRYVSSLNLVEGIVFQRFAARVNARKAVAAC